MNAVRASVNRLCFQTQRQRLTRAIQDRASFRQHDPLLEVLSFPESLEPFPLENLKLKRPSGSHYKQYQEKYLGYTQTQPISSSRASHGNTIT
jgi:hypothetical protein